jgi:plasmid maintenance system antidote protein VapI
MSETSDRPPQIWKPAEVFHPSYYVHDELVARGWDLDRLAHEMGGDFGINRLALDMFFAVHDPNARLGEMADQFAHAFGTSAELFRNLEAAYIRDQQR